ncbi:FAD/NAD(P)-binding protein [Blastococcus sp. SYSU DS0539]
MDGQLSAEAPAHDLVFVGAGASTSYTLLALLRSLQERPAGAPLRIAVVERSPDPFTGVPYGRRAARTSLLITALRDFLPGPERALFVEWLGDNKDWVFEEFLAAEGPFSARWWARHEQAVQHDEFDLLYLPRYTFGEFLARRTREAIARAEAAGVATTEIVREDVVAIEPAGHGYAIRCTDRVLDGHRVVLATGSAPVLPRLQQDLGAPTAVFVDDPFADMGEAVDRIVAAVAGADGARPAHVAVIGANASTMDMLYQLNDAAVPGLGHTVFTVVSPSGQLPERLDERRAVRPFHPERLAALEEADAVDAAAVYRAAVADIAGGRAQGLSVSDTLPPISAAVGRVLRRLPEEETAEFADRWGVELGRHQRRAGWEYCEVVDRLSAENRLRLVAGSFVDLVAGAGDQVHVRYRADGELHRLPTPVDAVVNCAGPARSLRQAAPPLLSQLITSGVCRLTPSGGGIAVDSAMAAAPGLYVMGPLLAGNVVDGVPVWHMEHCGRISAFGTALGTDLARTLVASGS